MLAYLLQVACLVFVVPEPLSISILQYLKADSFSLFFPSAVRRIVNVHRSLIKEDLIKLFADPTVLQQELDWRVIDNHNRQEEGVGSGVQRDILATFWQGIFSSLTLGDVKKVPCIRHDHQKTEWEAICRVLVYGYRFAGCTNLPIITFPGLLYLWGRVYQQGRPPYLIHVLCYS